jgi:hypothetical protein
MSMMTVAGLDPLPPVLLDVHTWTREAGPFFARKCAPRVIANFSIGSTGCWLAMAYTVFFMVSVGRTRLLSPLVYTRS